jgi:hypothetical protein
VIIDILCTLTDNARLAPVDWIDGIPRYRFTQYSRIDRAWPIFYLFVGKIVFKNVFRTDSVHQEIPKDNNILGRLVGRVLVDRINLDINFGLAKEAIGEVEQLRQAVDKSQME